MSKKLTPEQIKLLKAHMQASVTMEAGKRESFIAETLGGMYDIEFPIPEVVGSVFDVRRAEVGEHVYYLAPANVTKTLYTLTSNCIVTQTPVSPSARQELAFTSLISPEYYICIDDWIAGDHDVLKLYADAIIEAMDRQEAYAVLALLDAGAVANSNEFTFDTADTTFTYPKLVAMARSIAKYGKDLVLITGANVTTDIMLMDYDADTQREFDIKRLISKWIPIEELTVTINGTPTTVIDPDVAYLVAVSDSKGNKPGIFARRKIMPAISAPDTTAVAKERVIIDTGNMINVGTDRLFAKGKAGFESYGSVLLNPNVIAKFTRE